MQSNIIKHVKLASNNNYIFWLNLLFFVFLLIVNPSNYIIAFSFIFLFAMYYLKIRNFELSLLFTFISSLIIKTGKTYLIQLVPAGVFNAEIFPYGFFYTVTITATHFISFVMFLYLIRQFISQHVNFKLNTADFFIIVFYILKILSALFGSDKPEFSIIPELLSLSCLIAYIFVRSFIDNSSKLRGGLSYLLAAIVIFESILGFTQFVAKSPINKRVESQVNIEYFGHSVDETQFTFRPVGTFDHANTLGIWVSSISIILLAVAIKNKTKIFQLSFLSGFTLMIATISRSAWLGFFVGLLFLTVNIYINFKNVLMSNLKYILRWRFLFFPFILILVVVFVLPRMENSLYSFQYDQGGGAFRRIQNLDTVEIIKLNPLLGIGSAMDVYEGIKLNLNTFSARLPLEVHNWFLAIAIDNGLPAIFVFIIFIILSLIKILRSNNKSIFSLSIASFILCLLVAAIFQPIINFEFIILLLSLTNNDNIRLIDAKEITSNRTKKN
jgi:hypothetical protein